MDEKILHQQFVNHDGEASGICECEENGDLSKDCGAIIFHADGHSEVLVTNRRDDEEIRWTERQVMRCVKFLNSPELVKQVDLMIRQELLN